MEIKAKIKESLRLLEANFQYLLCLFVLEITSVLVAVEGIIGM